MVVVKIEMWPHGDESKAYPLGQINIANDDTGTESSGNYKAELLHAGRYWGKPGAYRTGQIKGFPRALSPYHLIARVLGACGIIWSTNK